MNGYWDEGKDRVEVLVALKQTLRERLPAAEVDPIFSITYDNENQFFLKQARQIIWARVFYQPFCERFGEMLHKEFARLHQTFKLEIKPCIFFPAMTSGKEWLKALPGNPSVFEYRFIFTGSSKKMLLAEWHPHQEQSRSGEAVKKQVPLPSQGHFRLFKQAQLTREELTDLIELSLQLRD